MNEQNGIVIESIGIYHPEKQVDTKEVLEGCTHKIRFPMEKVSGIKSRPMAGNREFSIDLARKAVENCLANSSYKAADIDLILCCNISRYDAVRQASYEPGTSLKLKKHFGMTHTMAFDISNACAGMFTGILLTHAFLEAGLIRRGLVVSGEHITHLTETAQQEIENYMDQRMACLTLGDAGAAVILERGNDPETGFQYLDIATLGAHSQHCTAKLTTGEAGGFIMLTDSINLTDAAMKAGAIHATQAMRHTHWMPQRISQLIMHQTSKLTLNSARDEMNRVFGGEFFNPENTVNNLEVRGNSASTTHMVAVADQIAANKLHPGDQVAFGISASGLTVGTALYAFDDLPDRMRSAGDAIKSDPERLVNTQVNTSPITCMKVLGIGTAAKEGPEVQDSMKYTVAAARDCLSNAAISSTDIDLLIYCGIYRSQHLLEPSYASLLAGELHANAVSLNPAQKTLAFDIFNGAVGFTNACQAAQAMMTAGRCQTAMIVASEFENNLQDFPEQLIGLHEGASAIVLTASEEGKIGFSQSKIGYEVANQEGYRIHLNYRQKSPVMEITKADQLVQHMLSCIAKTVTALLEEYNLDPETIDFVLPPQQSEDFIDKVQQTLNLPRATYINAVGGSPDLFSSSATFAFRELLETHAIKPGAIALVITAGSGIQAGCSLYYF